MRLRRIGLYVLVAVLALYVWAQRPRRYQVIAMTENVVLMLDTAPGERRVYEIRAASEGRFEIRHMTYTPGFSLLYRIRPYL